MASTCTDRPAPRHRRAAPRAGIADVELMLTMCVLTLLLMLAFGAWQVTTAMQMTNRAAFADLRSHTDYSYVQHFLVEPANSLRQIEYGNASAKSTWKFASGYTPPSWLSFSSLPNVIAFGSGGPTSAKVFAGPGKLAHTDSGGYLPAVKFKQLYMNPATPPWTWQETGMTTLMTTGDNHVVGGAGPRSLKLDPSP